MFGNRADVGLTPRTIRRYLCLRSQSLSQINSGSGPPHQPWEISTSACTRPAFFTPWWKVHPCILYHAANARRGTCTWPNAVRIIWNICQRPSHYLRHELPGSVPVWTILAATSGAPFACVSKTPQMQKFQSSSLANKYNRQLNQLK